MYVVDMYRGVVQAGGIWSDYLTDYIKAHDLELPVGKGGSGASCTARPARRSAAPALSKATPRAAGADAVESRRAGGATRRSGCWSSAATRRSRRA